MSSSSYLTDLQCMDVRASGSSEATWAILDAIEAAGPLGADIEGLASKTHYEGRFLSQVLRNLRETGMASSTADMRYRVTALGKTARSVASN
jgi:hypothetical protein